MLLAVGGDVIKALFDANKSGIPIVGGVSDSPVRAGIAASLARPGKNYTGEILARPGERRGNSRPHRAVADTADDRYATLVCVEERLDDITANREQHVGLLRDEFAGQFRKTRRSAIGVPVADFDVAAIDKAVLNERVLQRPIDLSQRGIAEYEPSDPEAAILRGSRGRCRQQSHEKPSAVHHSITLAEFP